jgi:hypothetical protein
MMIIHKWNVSGTSQLSIMTIIIILMIMTYDNGSGKNIVNNKNNPFINCIIIRSQKLIYYESSVISLYVL